MTEGGGSLDSSSTSGPPPSARSIMSASADATATTAASTASSLQLKGQPQQAAEKPKPDAQPKKLSAAEAKAAKEAKKQAKQARRAENKAAGAAPGGTSGHTQQRAESPTSTKQQRQTFQGPKGAGREQQKGGKGQQQQQQQQGQQQQVSDKQKENEPVKKNTPFFAHLEGDRPPIDVTKAHRDVHPAIVELSIRLKNFDVAGSSARCLSMLRAFQYVIRDYVTPPNVAIPRNLTHHLGRQIDQLILGRPLSITQGNAIRWLKNEIANIDPSMPEIEAKEYLIDSIGTFMKERITFAHEVVAHMTCEKIRDGDVIITYAKSSTVERVLTMAHKAGRKFSVIVVDSRPLFEGKNLVASLNRLDIPVTYTLIHGLSSVIKRATKALFGASCMLANGNLFSRCGTAMVALEARSQQKPVIVCCETLKFTDRIALDSIVMNELAPPDALVNIATGSSNYEEGPLENHREVPNLHIINLLYDVTPAKFITMVVTELGPLPPTSVPVVHNLIHETQAS